MTEIRRVRAPNPGPYTGPGTNTWLVGSGPALVVIDPGPDDPAHLAAIEAALGGAAVGSIVVSHSHPDHLPLAAKLAERHQAHVARWPELRDGDAVRVGGVNLIALHTPGHAPDHLCFWIEEDRVAFTGDLVLGQGSTMITYPEGDVAAYLASLRRLEELRPRMLFPGHWDPISDPAAKLAEYRRHRLEREAQILAELKKGGGTPSELTQRVYASEIGPDAALQVAAEMTLRAHLRKLSDEGQVSFEGDTYRVT